MNSPSGILLVDKPEGPTSHDVVSAVRRAVGIRRVGHAGTLDPFASGLLILLLGQATRLSEYLLRLEKSYVARVRLGFETTTADPEGEIVGEPLDVGRVTREGILDALAAFQGEIDQEPPVYSAKKVRGEAAHRRVRRGEEVRLRTSRVTVHEIALGELALPELEFRVCCSAGTYIRSLARDLGRALGVGGHLTALRRTAIGSFSASNALGMDEITGGRPLAGALIPPAEALPHLPPVFVSAEEAAMIRQGRSLPLKRAEGAEGEPIRILQGGRLVAIGEREGENLRPRKVLSP